MQLFHADSTTDLAAALTTLVWTDDNYPTEDDTSITINAAGNIEIEAAGAYLFMLDSTGFALPPAQGSQVEYDMTVIAGSTGQWSRQNTAPQVGAVVLLRIDESTGTSDASNSGNPDVSAVALWRTTDTFPAEIRVRALFVLDGNTFTATADPTFFLAITRLGDAFQ